MNGYKWLDNAHRQHNTQQQKLRFSTDSAPALNILTVMSEHVVKTNVNFMV
jgi:hypothetical protein